MPAKHQKAPAAWLAIPNAADGLKWSQNAGLMKLNFFISILYVGQILNGYDSSLISGLQAMIPWQEDMGHPDANRLGMLNALSFVAGALTGPLVTFVGDRYGRKQCLRYYGIMMCIGTIIGVAAGAPGTEGHGFAMFCVSKIVIGSGLIAGIITSQILVQEIAHPRYRATTASMFNVNWGIGFFIEAWVVFGCAFINNRWCWRIPYLIQMIPAIYVLVAVQFVPESPRWLMARGREDEAFQFLVEYHGNGNADDELVLFEFEEMKAALDAEKAAQAYKITKLFAGRANRHRLLLVAIINFMYQINGSSIVYYYYYQVLVNVGITSAVHATGINVGLTAVVVVMSITGVFIASRMGKRRFTLTVWPLYGVSLIVMAITGALFAKTRSNSSAIGTVFGLFYLYVCLGSIETPIFFAYPAEILHYSIRSSGMGVGNLVAQLGGVFNTWVNSIAYAALGWKFYLIYAPVVFVQATLMYFFMVETNGYTLEEIDLAFEGNSSVLNESRFRHPVRSEEREEWTTSKGED